MTGVEGQPVEQVGADAEGDYREGQDDQRQAHGYGDALALLNALRGVQAIHGVDQGSVISQGEDTVEGSEDDCQLNPQAACLEAGDEDLPLGHEACQRRQSAEGQQGQAEAESDEGILAGRASQITNDQWLVIAIANVEGVEERTGGEEGKTFHQAVVEQVEERSLGACGGAAIEADAEAEEDISDMGHA